ncbi:MAG: PAS domain S-box protein [Peptococcaceae bacterium]|nr:PAS domain S-box protein [Peptococcaceae bacterium]
MDEENKNAQSTGVFKDKLTEEIIDFLPDPTFVVDKDGRITAWNKAIEEMTGMPAQQMLGKGNYQYALPFFGERRPMLVDLIMDKTDIVAGFYPNVMTEGKAKAHEGLVPALKGKKVFIRCKATPLLDKEGNIIGAIESIRDITESKISQEQMERYNILFNQTRDIVLYVMLDGKIVEANQAALDAYGYSKEELLSLTVFDLRPKETHPMAMAQLEKANASGTRFETIHQRKDGSKFYVEVSSRGVDLNHQRVLLSTIRDITERKKAEQALFQSILELKETLEGTVHALATVTEKRDLYTAGHQKRVADLAVIIGKEMGLDRETLDNIKIAGILHDIGKINLPAEILIKPAKLTDLETALVRTHSRSGYEIIKNIPFKSNIASIILQHHERIDGSGYPDGLRGEEILIEARILAVADVIEAMASHRPYRASLGIHRAIAEIIGNRGVLYDCAVVDACLAIYRQNILNMLLQTNDE